MVLKRNLCDLEEAEIQTNLSDGKRQAALVGTSVQLPMEGPCWGMWDTCCLGVLALHIPFQKSKGCVITHCQLQMSEWLLGMVTWPIYLLEQLNWDTGSVGEVRMDHSHGPL